MQALLAAYPAYEGRARASIGEALLVIEHPATPNALADLRLRAGSGLASDLQQLEARFIRPAK
jgi:hypothetical protein